MKSCVAQTGQHPLGASAGAWAARQEAITDKMCCSFFHGRSEPAQHLLVLIPLPSHVKSANSRRLPHAMPRSRSSRGPLGLAAMAGPCAQRGPCNRAVTCRCVGCRWPPNPLGKRTHSERRRRRPRQRGALTGPSVSFGCVA